MTFTVQRVVEFGIQRLDRFERPRELGSRGKRLWSWRLFSHTSMGKTEFPSRTPHRLYIRHCQGVLNSG
jgi:hypothetical protein